LAECGGGLGQDDLEEDSVPRDSQEADADLPFEHQFVADFKGGTSMAVPP
jgi:hypothetical protein